MKLQIITLLGFAAFLVSCEQTVHLDMDQTPSKIVIEGFVTDQADHNYVKVSRTNDFYSSGNTPRVTDATVMVEDNEGTIFNFSHYSGDSPDSAGLYFPETPFAGVAGRTYKLTVVAGGEIFTAEDKLLRLVPLEKIEYRINDEEQQDPEDPDRFYEVLLFVKEPKETKDFYLFKCFRNGEIEYAAENDIYFSDDELIGENIDGVPLPVFFAKDDLARVEVYSMSRDAFVYYRDLQKLLTNDGGLFGTPPANPRSNLSGDALGFFQVSAIQAGEIEIQ
jgi:hypothetical protein